MTHTITGGSLLIQNKVRRIRKLQLADVGSSLNECNICAYSLLVIFNHRLGVVLD